MGQSVTHGSRVGQLGHAYHASRFIFSSFLFNFSVCPVWWTKLFYCTLNTQYRIVSYRIVSRHQV